MIVEQLIKKNCKTGEVQEVNPITSFEAVKDSETGKTLRDILINGNHIYVPFTSNSKAITRSQVPMNYRRRGLWITYVSCQGKVTTEWYNSDEFDDVSWGSNNNWVKYIDDQYIKDLVIDFVQEQFGDIDLRIDNNTKAIENIIGTSGAASKDEFINTITDITRFFTGYTTSDTLRGVVDGLDVASKEALASAIAEVNNTIQQVDSKIQEVQGNVEQVEETVEGVRAAATYASNAAEEASARVGDLSDQVITLDSTLRSEVTTIKASVNSVNTKVINLENQVGAASGIAPLGPDGRIPSSNLPSYVDDVLEYDSIEEFPSEGEEGKIYVAKDTNLTYRWSGTQYIEISPSLGLGETAQTAYPGNKGKKNADDIAAHIADVNNPHQVTKDQVGLDNVDNTSDLNKPISAAQQLVNTQVNTALTEYNDRLTAVEESSGSSTIKSMTQSELDSYTPENEGELIYNTDTKQYVYWNGDSWVPVGGREMPSTIIDSATWVIHDLSDSQPVIPRVGDKRIISPPALSDTELEELYRNFENASTESEIAEVFHNLTNTKPIILRLVEEEDDESILAYCNINELTLVSADGNSFTKSFLVSWIANTTTGNCTVIEKLSYQKATEEQNGRGDLTAECIKSTNLGPIQVVPDVHHEGVIITQGDLVYDTSKGGFLYRDKFNNIKQVAEADKFNLIGFVESGGEDFDSTPNIGVSQRILFPDCYFNEDGFEISELESIFQESSNFKVTLNSLLDGYKSFDLIWYVSLYKYIIAPCTVEITYNTSETSPESWPVFTWMWGSKLITSELRYVLFDEENMPSGSGNLTKGYLQLQVTKIVVLNSNEINWIYV